MGLRTKHWHHERFHAIEGVVHSAAATVVPEERDGDDDLVTLDLDQGLAFDVTLTGDADLEIINAHVGLVYEVLLVVRQDEAGAHALDLADISWSGAVVPTASVYADAVDVYRLTRAFGVWVGEVLGQNLTGETTGI